MVSGHKKNVTRALAVLGVAAPMAMISPACGDDAAPLIAAATEYLAARGSCDQTFYMYQPAVSGAVTLAMKAAGTESCVDGHMGDFIVTVSNNLSAYRPAGTVTAAALKARREEIERANAPKP